MLYHGFYVKFTSLENIQREKKDGSTDLCGGFQIEIFSDSSEKIPLDAFTAAVGLEILNNSVQDAEQFAMDVIESEEKEYLKLLEEYDKNNNSP